MSELESTPAPEATDTDAPSTEVDSADASESKARGGRKASSDTDVESLLSEDGEADEGEAKEAKPKAEKAAEKRKYRVKVDETEEEIEEDELLRGYQKAKASDKRFQEAARKEKAIEDLYRTAKTDPASVLKAMGVDFDKAAEERLLAKLEDSMLSPEQRELRDLRAERARREAEAAESQAEQEKTAQAEAYAKAIEEIDADIHEALQAAGLKPTPRTIARVTEYMLANLDAEQGRLPAKEAFSRVKNDYAEDVKEWLGSLPVEEVVKTLPPEVLSAIRAHDVAQARSKLSSPPSKEQAAPTASGKRNAWKSLDELLG